MLRYATILILLSLLAPAAAAKGGKDDIFYRERAIFDPFPRQVELNGTLTLRTTLRKGYRSPVIALTHPDGETQYLYATRTISALIYEFDVGFKAGEGRYRLALVVDSKRGDTHAAQFSVHVGERREEETAPGPRPESAYPSEHPAESTVRLERKLFFLVNGYREEKGLEPYPWLEEAARLARDHMTDYLALKPRPKKLTHRIPGKDTIADRFMDFNAWPRTIPKFPVKDPKIGPKALSYCAECLAAPRSVDWLFNEVFKRESSFRAPLISEYPTHAAVGMVRDRKSGRLYTATVYVQINSTSVRTRLAEEYAAVTKRESGAGGKPEERAELLRGLGRMGDPRSRKTFLRRIGDRRPVVRAAALDALFLNDPDRAAEWLDRQLLRLVRAHRAADYAEAVKILRVFSLVRFDVRTRTRGEKGIEKLETRAAALLAEAEQVLAEGGVKEAHAMLSHLAGKFAGLDAAKKAAAAVEGIESDPDLRAKLGD